MATPPPEEDETPEDDEIPDEEDVPAEVPEAGDPEDEDEPVDRCGSIAVMCANLAPMTAAAAADSSPTRQVIFLTRRRPSSRASAALEYWERVTASGSPLILWDETDALLRNVGIAVTPRRDRPGSPGLRAAQDRPGRTRPVS